MSEAVMTLSAQAAAALDRGFSGAFGKRPERYFSAPGRVELSGNHTDHQRGRILAGAVDVDTRAAVRPNGTDVIRVRSRGYPLFAVELKELEPVEEEKNTTAALIRGVAAGFRRWGGAVAGFDAYVESDVLPGSGLSSSAAFEVLMGTIINRLFNGGRFSPAEVARIGQYAENVFFGKPCGLMDQMASALGGMVTIDFADPDLPEARPVDFDFGGAGYGLCVIDSGADHADLTGEYAAIPGELKALCGHFGKEVTRELTEEAFYGALRSLREACGDRAVLRAIHEFDENRRVGMQVEALERGDVDGFLRLVGESGRSSWMYLQNVIPAGSVRGQALAVALALCGKYLDGKGAFRVHGGGFAGTALAFVPVQMLDAFCAGIESALGKGACHVMGIRPFGGVEMTPENRNE